MKFSDRQVKHLFLLTSLVLGDVFIFRSKFFLFQWIIFFIFLVFFREEKNEAILNFLKRVVVFCFFTAGLFFLSFEKSIGEQFLNWGIIFIFLLVVNFLKSERRKT